MLDALLLIERQGLERGNGEFMTTTAGGKGQARQFFSRDEKQRTRPCASRKQTGRQHTAWVRLFLGETVKQTRVKNNM